MQKHVNLVDLVKSFPTIIFLQNLASIQKRTSPIKFARLAGKSENCSIWNLSTKVRCGCVRVRRLGSLRRMIARDRRANTVVIRQVMRPFQRSWNRAAAPVK